MFFLGIAILQFFSTFSTISPGVVILPLVIIIGLTALKDGYEDFKRHQSDRRVNYSTVKVLSGGNWTNPNPMQKKSKTFIRGIVNTVRRPQHFGVSRERTNGSQSATLMVPDPDVEYDYDSPKQGGPHWKQTLWEDVRVGDFVKLQEGSAIPADILICATPDEENVAFVETKNLDGETNLKSRNAVSVLTQLRDAAACADPANSFRIECDRPETNMYRLNATVDVQGEKHAADLQTVLLRGSVIRNTSWVIGVVLFTGEDTKIVMNSGVTPSKRSRVERQVNPQVIANLIILAGLVTICAIVDSSLEKEYFPLGALWLYGDDRSGDNPRINGIITWLFAILTFQDIVPISLYLTIEGVRACQALFIYFDKDIYYDKTDKATLPRSWNLSDDLGQIEYIFSDKTGTLTQNSMVFRQCSIGGKAYRGDPESIDTEEDLKHDNKVQVESRPTPSSSSALDAPSLPKPDAGVVHFSDSVLKADLEDALSEHPNPDKSSLARSINGFFTVLALCHSVLTSVDPMTSAIQYKSQSPDETALVQAAADVGFVFLERNHGILSLQTPSSPEVEKYELLNILEFTSARKRMSVIIRKLGGDDNRIFLLTKGADSVIFERLKAGGDDLKNATERHLSEFANEGLRTLTLAYKVISEEEYDTWIQRYHEATIALEEREEKIEAASDEMERDLRLLGATAIEDRLQDGVPETIADLKRAGIKVWVATGDKLETAIAIGRSTNLVSHDSNIIIIRGGSRPVDQQISRAFAVFFPDFDTTEKIEKQPRSSMTSHDSRPRLERVDTGFSSIVGSENGERPGGFVLVVDGAALLQAFATEENKTQLLRLAMLCDGVICCRVSPLQKALIVRLVKDGLGAMTLAIGDGANDVSMIQAADVGVGISGEEGLQAVNSSDYAIAQFRFLKKLLLVHGHWSYARNGTMILNFFYKNIVPTCVLLWFQIYCAGSATYAFDYTYILFWNSFWTIAPVVGLGLFDRFLDSHVLMDLPELYHYGREGYWFSMKQFFIFLLDGAYQSLVIFFMILFAYATTSARSDGYDVRLLEFSTVMAIVGVMTVNMFTGLCATAWTWWMFGLVFIGIVLVWGFTIIYNFVSPGYAVTALYGNNYFLFTSAYYWLLLPFTIILSLAPRYIAKAYKFGYAPDDIDIVRWIRKKHPLLDLANDSRAHLGVGLFAMKGHHRRVSSVPGSGRSSRAAQRVSTISRADSVTTIELTRPVRASMDLRNASRTDMSTGVVSVDRGFDFATEEGGGVMMKRMQSNLSEKRISSNPRFAAPAESSSARKGKEAGLLGHGFSLRRGLKRSLLGRKASTVDEGGA